jgi:hypothetical protein
MVGTPSRAALDAFADFLIDRLVKQRLAAQSKPPMPLKKKAKLRASRVSRKRT